MSLLFLHALSRALPRDVLEDIAEGMKKGTFPSACEGLSDAVLYRFRSMTAGEIALLPEVSEGLENLFAKYSMECSDFSELVGAVKSKRYTMARLKRIVMCGLLGITRELQDSAFSDDEALYARVLGVRADSQELLKFLCEKASIPVIIKASDREKLSEMGRKTERISAFAHSVHALGRPYEKPAAADSSYRLIVR